MGKKSVPVVLTSKEGAALAFNRAARDGTQKPYLQPKKGKWEDGKHYRPNVSKQEKRRAEYMTRVTINKNLGKIEDK